MVRPQWAIRLNRILNLPNSQISAILSSNTFKRNIDGSSFLSPGLSFEYES